MSRRSSTTNGFLFELRVFIAYNLIRIMGTFISFISLIWMPWKVRVYWAKFVYKLTYINPLRYPLYIKFIEEMNKKYNMGKKEKNMYLQIYLIKQNSGED